MMKIDGSKERDNRGKKADYPLEVYTTIEFQKWKSMKGRCNTNKHYKNVFVCARWLESYFNFLEDMGKCPQGYSIERKDNNKGYTPTNCTWIPLEDQTLNKTRTHKFDNGMTVASVCNKLGISRGAVLLRIKLKGLSPIDALYFRHLNPTKLTQQLEELGIS